MGQQELLYAIQIKVSTSIVFGCKTYEDQQETKC